MNVGMTTLLDSHKELLDAPVASLTTIGGSGYPQSTLTWFVYNDGKLELSLSDARQKTKNLIKNPKVSLLILDPDSPMRYLEIRGDATAVTDTGLAFAHGPLKDKYAADVTGHDGPGDVRMLVTIEPTNVYAVDMRG